MTLQTSSNKFSKYFIVLIQKYLAILNTAAGFQMGNKIKFNFVLE
jgi:hypothetical protein